MPRTDDLKDLSTVWASGSDAEKDLEPRSGEPALSAERGYGPIYSARDGSKPTRRQFNQMFYWLTKHIDEANKHGMFEWDGSVGYVHPAAVIGGDSNIYISVQDSTNRNPVTDASSTWWTPVAPTSRLLPASNGPAGSYLTGSKTWGSLSTDVISHLSGRLLPTADGADGTFLAHDKTFRTISSGYQRTELVFGDYSFNNEWGQGGRRFRQLNGNYVVTDWDWIEVYVRNNSPGHAADDHLLQSCAAHPLNIPIGTASADAGVADYPGSETTPNGQWQGLPYLFNSPGGSVAQVSFWRTDNGRLFAAVRQASHTSRTYHFSVYGTRYQAR